MRDYERQLATLLDAGMRMGLGHSALVLAGAARLLVQPGGRAVSPTALPMQRREEVHLNRGVICTDHLRQDEAAERELRRALPLCSTLRR